MNTLDSESYSFSKKANNYLIDPLEIEPGQAMRALVEIASWLCKPGELVPVIARGELSLRKEKSIDEEKIMNFANKFFFSYYLDKFKTVRALKPILGYGNIIFTT